MIRRGRLRPLSQRRRALAVAYHEFRLTILARDGNRCTYCRESRGPLDLHHTRKPRARYLMDDSTVTTLCRRCHDRCEAAYAAGRLVVTPLGGGLFHYRTIFAVDKWAARDTIGV